jgi:hypothetical protein
MTADPWFLATATSLADALVSHHWNEDAGALNFASSQATELIARPCFGHDDATPNANAVMQSNFARLALLTGDRAYEAKARSIHESFAAQAISNPFGYAAFFEASLDLLDPIQAIVAGARDDPSTPSLLARVIRDTGPDCIVGHVAAASELPSDHPAARKEPAGGKPRLYLCRGQVCAAPASTVSDVEVAVLTLGLAP